MAVKDIGKPAGTPVVSHPHEEAPPAADPTGGIAAQQAIAICLTTALRPGEVGAKVKELQHALNALGAVPPLHPDGKFGQKTAAALLALQTGSVSPAGKAAASPPGTLQALLKPELTIDSAVPRAAKKDTSARRPDPEPAAFDARLSSGHTSNTH